MNELDAIKARLANLEAAHADLNIAFHRRTTEFESRLDAASAEIKDFKTVAIHLNERLTELKTLVKEIGGVQSLETELGQQLVAVRAQLTQLLHHNK